MDSKNVIFFSCLFVLVACLFLAIGARIENADGQRQTCEVIETLTDYQTYIENSKCMVKLPSGNISLSDLVEYNDMLIK